MHIKVEIDDRLMARAEKLAGMSDRGKIIEHALSLLISTREHERQHESHAHMVWEDTDDDTPIV